MTSEEDPEVSDELDDEFDEAEDEGPEPIDVSTPAGRLEGAARIGGVFTPAQPVSSHSLFAGRIDQLSQLLTLTQEAGTHGVIYGERGVGKTSLAATMVNLLLHRRGIAARANCDAGDTYSSVWKKVLDSITIIERRPGTGFNGEVEEAVRVASEYLPPKNAGPGDVMRILFELAQLSPPVIFLDEFDRISNPEVRAMFADTIKMLSDQEVPTTVVLVGVADTVDELIAEHASVERALVQIQMPRMSRAELEQIVDQGMSALAMNIDKDALKRITGLSQGLPHYTHLLAREAALVAVQVFHTLDVDATHVNEATGRAIGRAQRSVVTAYHNATASPQKATLYPQVLLATALAQGDELGFFSPGDVRAPLSAIMSKPVEIPSFVRHLHSLAERDRGAVLQKRGPKRRHRFRFSNPLLQPYVVMHGLHEGLLSPSTFEKFS